MTKPGVGHLHDVVQRVDLSKILLETDAPHFRISLPHNVKSDLIQPWSHPGHTIFVALRIAELKGVDWRTIIKETRENVKQGGN